jgi:cobalt-zinc-cadmium efflux system membrane fusion protein
MNRSTPYFLLTATLLSAALIACGHKEEPAKGNGGAPPPAQVQKEPDANLWQVDHPEQFPLVKAEEYASASTLRVTGVVSPDVSRTVPVISLASGRVVEIRARLGDSVKKGQVLLRVQSTDISAAFSDYRKAVVDEVLIRTQLDRAKLLYDKGAISLNDYQVAQDAEDKAKVDVENALEHLHVLGLDKDHPGAIVSIVAPVSGVITDQQVTAASGVQGLSTTNPFTISDLSTVWILCDVYENDLPNVHMEESVEIHLNAYPDKLLQGKISNIGAVLDPSLRTAKVRVEVPNPRNFLGVGMFATATFHGQKKELHAALPSTAILHLHDRDWVYVPAGGNKFRRVEVTLGSNLPDKKQEIRAGINPGQEVVSNALVLQNTVEE